MRKKTERSSFKKLIVLNKKQQSKFVEDLKDSAEKQRPQSKHKSTERVIAAYETNANKFKISKNGQRQRIKTEIDEFLQTRMPIGKVRKEQRPRNTKGISEKGKLTQTRNFNLKKLYLGGQITEAIKNSSLEKCDTPHSGKHYSFRKAHESHRSGTKRTALEKYISESFESLQLANKRKLHSNTKQSELKNTVKKQSDQGVLKVPKALSRQKYIRDDGGEIKYSMQGKSSREKDGKLLIFDKQSKIEKQAKGQETQSHKEQKNYIQRQRQWSLEKEKQKQSVRRGEKQESLQKIQIKWQKKKKNPYDLSREEMQTFGDRFPDGFDKLRLLGRGGFSLVWLGEHKKSKKKYAIKQIITESSHQTHIKQIWFGTYFFEFGGAAKEQFANSPGIKHLVKLYYYFINKKDTWILYQKCGDSLGNALYELKSEQYNGQKVYRMHYKNFYVKLRGNQKELRRIILDVAKALELLAENSIVHSDLKTENILVRLREQQVAGESTLLQTKLIDYGSSFVFNNLRQFSMATPEYMAPEILNFILYENQFQYIPKLLEYVQKYSNPWVIDVWSLGSVLLQIVSGIPLWMSLKTLVKKKSQEVIRYGLFAIKGRAFDKIIKQQLEVVQNLQHYLYEQNYSGIYLEQDLKILLKRMLALNPAKRISPSEIIEYLQAKVQ